MMQKAAFYYGILILVFSCSQTKPNLLSYEYNNYGVLLADQWQYGLRVKAEILDQDHQLNRDTLMISHQTRELSWPIQTSAMQNQRQILMIDTLILAAEHEDIVGELNLTWRENFGFTQEVKILNQRIIFNFNEIPWQELQWQSIEIQDIHYFYCFYPKDNLHFMIDKQHPKVAHYVTYIQSQ